VRASFPHTAMGTVHADESPDSDRLKIVIKRWRCGRRRAPLPRRRFMEGLKERLDRRHFRNSVLPQSAGWPVLGQSVQVATLPELSSSASRGSRSCLAARRVINCGRAFGPLRNSHYNGRAEAHMSTASQGMPSRPPSRCTTTWSPRHSPLRFALSALWHRPALRCVPRPCWGHRREPADACWRQHHPVDRTLREVARKAFELMLLHASQLGANPLSRTL